MFFCSTGLQPSNPLPIPGLQIQMSGRHPVPFSSLTYSHSIRGPGLNPELKDAAGDVLPEVAGAAAPVFGREAGIEVETGLD